MQHQHHKQQQQQQQQQQNNNMTQQPSTIADVLSGNQSIKVDIGIDSKSAILGGVVLFVVVLVVGVLIKKI